jgi:uncharacterized protein
MRPSRSNFKLFAYSVGGFLLVCWIGTVGLLYATQRRLLFQPDPERVAPVRTGLMGVREEVIATPDGERLIAWWSPPAAGKPVFLYFHGNGGNLTARAGRLKLFQQAGFGGLMLSARGYGGSSGHPSESALVADAKLAFDWLVSHGVAADQIIVFGESLGTGLAVQVAAERPARALILDSPYTSLVDVAAGKFPWIPVRWLMTDQMDSMAVIGKVRAPLLVIHGDQDDLVPYVLGAKLFAAANEPKRLLTLPGVGHVAPLKDGAWTTVLAFVGGLHR